LLCVTGCAQLAADAKPERAPNVLFILTDQHRRDCVGAYGNPEIHTPNIDRIAREGVRFDRAYAAQPVCSPNRAAILTGLYPHTSGVWENCKGGWEDRVSLPKSVPTMAEMLRPAGYDCGYFGKWHLGRRDAFETFPEYPGDGRGDNHYFGEGADRRYGVDVITDDAVRFVARERTRPFYVYVSLYPPHPPFSAPQAYVDRYKHIEDREKRVYYAMCTKVDEKVGELLAALDELEIAARTLVVFTTDHGHNFEQRWNHHHKRLCYDAAARLPLVARMPGVLPAGRVTDGLISSVDLTPTILGLISQPVPAGLQGRDLSALARGPTEQGRDYLFIENIPFPFDRGKGEERCVMDKEWKLILSTQREPELYHVESDPDERQNRWEKMKDSPEVRRLTRELHAWARRTSDSLAPQLLTAVSH
jgi:arylsulfatase A-like enzyme